MGFQSQLEEALSQIESDGLRRHPPRISGAQGPEILVDGRPVLSFCSNNYLGLADHPRIVEACRRAAMEDGAGAAASRLITGTMDAHLDAEQALAEFLGTEDAVLFSSGYAANLGTIQALLGRGDAVFSDALNHASLIDGCRLSRAQVHIYPHRDVERLESLLREHRGGANRALLVTDSLFSMDGDTAPLERIAELASHYDAGLMLDEAHALGVFGPAGRGLAAGLDLAPDLVVGTLGKSFGVAGAFVATTRSAAELIRNRARSFVYSTAPAPVLARAAIEALSIVKEADHARLRLLENAARLRSELASLGFEVPKGNSQIIPVLIGENDRTMRLSAELLDRGVFVQGIRPPTVAVGAARLRLTPMATHRPEQIDRALDAFAAVARSK